MQGFGVPEDSRAGEGLRKIVRLVTMSSNLHPGENLELLVVLVSQV